MLEQALDTRRDRIGEGTLKQRKARPLAVTIAVPVSGSECHSRARRPGPVRRIRRPRVGQVAVALEGL